jgi:hypothetical protein
MDRFVESELFATSVFNLEGKSMGKRGKKSFNLQQLLPK